MDECNARDFGGCVVGGEIRGEALDIGGHFELTCYDEHGNELWQEEFSNLWTTAGKNAVLNKALAGSGYTAANFVGLIGGASTPTLVAGDVMTSHAGWLEAGNANPPTYTAPRKSGAFGSASAGTISLSNSGTFVATGSGTVAGAFIVGFDSATNTIDNTAGTLLCEGTFTGQPVISGNTLTIGYGLTLT